MIESKKEYDARWVLCKRPIEFAGGELTMSTLDLAFNPSAKYYKAPPHIKANGGVFLIDDFGRQLVRPRDLLNRWIVPLEKRVDYLTLHTGKVFQLPFDTIVLLNRVLCAKKVREACRVARKLRTLDAPQVVARRDCEQTNEGNSLGETESSV